MTIVQVTDWRPVGKAETAKCPTPDCPGQLILTGRKGVCPVCKTTYQRDKPKHNSRKVVELTDIDMARILAHAKHLPSDFAILGFLASGFRRSETVGGDDNGVLLPGVHVEDILLEQSAVRITGKGQSGTIRDGLVPKTILQPVPRIFLEAALGLGVVKGPLFGKVNTHQVGKMVKEYARLAAVPEWGEVRAHRFRHWFSNAIRKRIGNQGPTALLEWSDTMRHSRKGGGTTVSFYSGLVTSFERRLEICLAAWQPVLDQLQSPMFLENLPPASPRPATIQLSPVRIVRNSDSLEAPGDFERGKTHDTIDMNKQQTTRSNQESAVDPVSAAPLPPVTLPPGARVEDPSALSPETSEADLEEPEPAHECVSTIGGQCLEPATRLWLGSWVCEGHYYDVGPLQPHVREWRSGRLVDLCDSLGCSEEYAYRVPGEPEPDGVTYLCAEHYRPRLLAKEDPSQSR